MKIEKRGTESYRVRKMYKGQMYTVTFDCKPTQKEAVQAMAKELDRVQEKHKYLTFQAAAAEYIESKKNVLSPSTVRLYRITLNMLSDKFKSVNIHDVTVLDIQAEVNRLAKDHSPKTVRNYHGFISAVLGSFRPELKIYTTLPQKAKNDPYIPSDEDVRKILAYARGSEYEIPLVLSCYGMRRSEICALTPEDIEGDVVHIRRAKVFAGDGRWVDKTTKTTASTRDIIIPPEIADRIREKGYVYKGHPNSISEYLGSVEDKLGIPRFTMHKLRHYFASKMSALNIPDADIMRMGGWETDHVMKSVYRHSMMERDETAKRIAADKLREAILRI